MSTFPLECDSSGSPPIPVGTGWSSEAVRLEPDSWSEKLRQFSDASIYQTRAYGEILWGKSQLSHFQVKFNRQLVGIAQVRLVTFPGIKRGVAYIRWGPLWRRTGKPEDLSIFRQIVASLRDEYALRGKFLVRILPNIFRTDLCSEGAESSLSELGFVKVSNPPRYRTFRLDISPRLEELRKRLDGKWRNKLSGAERNGLRIVEGHGQDLYLEFLSAYRQLMERKTFETTVDVNAFGQVQERAMDPFRMRIFLCYKENLLLNSLVVAPGGDSAIYILGATSDEGMRLKGSYLLHWRAIQWLKEVGVRWYDLGGINPEVNPGVFEFKKGFSGQEDFHLGSFEYSGSRLSSIVVNLGERLWNLQKRRNKVTGTKLW